LPAGDDEERVRALHGDLALAMRASVPQSIDLFARCP
jgi:hypothetical protein